MEKEMKNMTAEREMAILEAVAEKYGIAECLERLENRAVVLGDRAWKYRGRMEKAGDAKGTKKADASSLKRMAAEMSVWLNVLSVILGEPVEQEIKYLEQLAEEVGLDDK